MRLVGGLGCCVSFIGLCVSFSTFQKIQLLVFIRLALTYILLIINWNVLQIRFMVLGYNFS